MSLIGNCAQLSCGITSISVVILSCFTYKEGDSIPIIFHPFLRARIPVILVHLRWNRLRALWEQPRLSCHWFHWCLQWLKSHVFYCSSLSSTIWIWPFVLLTHRRQTQQKLWWLFVIFVWYFWSPCGFTTLFHGLIEKSQCLDFIMALKRLPWGFPNGSNILESHWAQCLCPFQETSRDLMLSMGEAFGIWMGRNENKIGVAFHVGCQTKTGMLDFHCVNLLYAT